MAEVLLGQTGSSPGLQTLNLVRYADNGSLTMTSLVWMERRKGMRWTVGKADVKMTPM